MARVVSIEPTGSGLKNQIWWNKPDTQCKIDGETVAFTAPTGQYHGARETAVWVPKVPNLWLKIAPGIPVT